MKAFAVFPARHEAKLINREPPRLREPIQVALRMLEIGICGTDKEISAFEYGTPPPDSDFLILGHESLGQVVEVGAAVTQVKPGDLAVVMVRRPCEREECTACRSGRPDFCYTGEFTERGIKGAHGFMTEYVVEEECYVVPLPQRLRTVGVLTEPLTIAEKAMTQVWQVQQRLPWACPVVPGQPAGYCHRAVVLGAGPVGLLGAALLVMNGFETTVYSLEPPTSPQAAFAKQIGAAYLCSKTTPPAQLPEAAGDIDLVYEATGAAQVAFEVMKVVGANGVFVFTGVPGRKGPISFDADLIMRNLVLKNQVVYGTVNASREAFEHAVRDLAVFTDRWPEAIRSLITGRHSIEAVSALVSGPKRGIKNVLSFDGDTS